MKKRIVSIILAGITILATTGCNSLTRSYGGSQTINLPANQKLELITWKDSSLWYCTRPMREGEFAETHTYQQKSEFGVIEGTVTIIETEE